MGSSQSIPVIASEVAATGVILLVGTFAFNAVANPNRGELSTSKEKKRSSKNKKGRKKEGDKRNVMPSVVVDSMKTFVEETHSPAGQVCVHCTSLRALHMLSVSTAYSKHCLRILHHCPNHKVMKIPRHHHQHLNVLRGREKGYKLSLIPLLLSLLPF